MPVPNPVSLLPINPTAGGRAGSMQTAAESAPKRCRRTWPSAGRDASWRRKDDRRKGLDSTLRVSLDDRLTDEKWQQMVREGTAPPAPVWTKSFTVGE